MRGTVCVYLSVTLTGSPGIRLAISWVNMLGLCCSSRAAALPSRFPCSKVWRASSRSRIFACTISSPTSIVIAKTAASLWSGNRYLALSGVEVGLAKVCVTVTVTRSPWMSATTSVLRLGNRMVLPSTSAVTRPARPLSSGRAAPARPGSSAITMEAHSTPPSHVLIISDLLSGLTKMTSDRAPAQRGRPWPTAAAGTRGAVRARCAAPRSRRAPRR